MEGNYYVWNVPASLMGATVNVIFSNGEGDQTVDINGVVLSDDVLITLTDNEGGKWNATVNGEAPVEPEKPAENVYGLVGTINGWAAPDIKFESMGNGGYKLLGYTIAASESFKIRANEEWNDAANYGLEAKGSLVTNEANTLICGGSSADMSVAADGTYDFYFYPETLTLYVMEQGKTPDVEPTPEPSISYGLVGTINGWAAPDVKFEAIGDGGYKLLGYTIAATEEIKIRANEEWNDAENYGLATAGVLTTNAANTLICGGGSANMKVAADGTYDFYFYPAELTLYVMEAGQVPAR
jgi:hypothetical protein